MKRIKYSIFLLIPVLFNGCLYFNDKGVSQYRYHECKEGFDANGTYFKECDKNLYLYKDIPPLLGIVDAPKKPLKNEDKKHHATVVGSKNTLSKKVKEPSEHPVVTSVKQNVLVKDECASIDMVAISQQNNAKAKDAKALKQDISMADIQKDIATLCGEDNE